MTDLLHVTLETGDARRSPRSEVADGVIAALVPLVERGGEIPWPTLTWRLERPGPAPVWTVTERRGPRRRVPLVTFGSARHAVEGADVWSELIAVAARVACPSPSAYPWLGVALREGVASANPEHVYMLGDMERCVAWAWLESQS